MEWNGHSFFGSFDHYMPTFSRGKSLHWSYSFQWQKPSMPNMIRRDRPDKDVVQGHHNLQSKDWLRTDEPLWILEAGRDWRWKSKLKFCLISHHLGEGVPRKRARWKTTKKTNKQTNKIKYNWFFFLSFKPLLHIKHKPALCVFLHHVCHFSDELAQRNWLDISSVILLCLSYWERGRGGE